MSKYPLPYDRQALIDLYESLNQPLYRYSVRLLGDPVQAEECVAETFSRLLQTLSNGALIDNPKAYLYRVAHNWITDSYRRQPPLEPLDEVHHVTSFSILPDTIMHRQNQSSLRSALMRLTADQRQVIVLRFLEDWPHEKIAQMIGKSTEATRALQYRALAVLRSILVENEEDEHVSVLSS